MSKGSQLVTQFNSIHETLKELEGSLQKKKKSVSLYQARMEDMLRKPLSSEERAEYASLTSQVEELTYNIVNNRNKVKFLEDEIKNVERTELVPRHKSFSKDQKRVQVVLHVTDEGGIKRSFTRHLIYKDQRWWGFHPLTHREFSFSF